ncbi:MAG: hypothetical protein F6K54_22340 [Okeania sp. SIO3B5]|uniref:hypothetical protein n=1 Tax=Okeania sp. SIO3B5 TaxID=2607811 RepID=UPI0013FF8CA5|nr:hypothetical protein [Okeania sp. SIO3B5]NEO55568.1 hypothetical protein [Okeania sp. SIO3B5]
MSGFIGALFGLFGGNQDDNQPKEDFFLDADSASSLGDVDFMRKSIAVKRSYPKAAGKINLIEGETEKSASSMKVKETIGETKTASYASSISTYSSTKSSTSSSTESSTSSSTESSTSSSTESSTSSSTESSTSTPTTVKPRSISDSNSEIDFTSMARNIRKKR